MVVRLLGTKLDTFARAATSAVVRDTVWPTVRLRAPAVGAGVGAKAVASLLLPPPQATKTEETSASKTAQPNGFLPGLNLFSNQYITWSPPSWADFLPHRSAFYQRAKRAGCAFWSVQVWWALMARAALIGRGFQPRISTTAAPSPPCSDRLQIHRQTPRYCSPCTALVPRHFARTDKKGTGTKNRLDEKRFKNYKPSLYTRSTGAVTRDRGKMESVQNYHNEKRNLNQAIAVRAQFMFMFMFIDFQASNQPLSLVNRAQAAIK